MSVPTSLDVEQAHPRLRELTVVDVRTPGEFASGHLPDAVNVPLDRLVRSLPELRRAAEGGPLLIVCASGARSAGAVATLAPHGVPASSLTGGTEAWAAAGHALVYPGGVRSRAVWAMERQVRFAAGALVLAGLLLGLLLHPAFALLSAAIGGGLVFSALTGTCGMAVVMGRLPFNRRPAQSRARPRGPAADGGNLRGADRVLSYRTRRPRRRVHR
ncbi:transporter [Streptomyces virginiae]|uniref:Transporter n=1 Tax=Streptomyces virginiae TaxID=1961 RepID=A0ABQ3NRU1_STRVG|nr:MULTISPECIES: rhodanese-like domain-containing protein [Streptomyces]MBP2348266.1 rhodanese-related sulfurtransferase [Streptomyces virginiae]MCI4084999.1 rhodanese-like domain-containing protein [Streptomyces sp. MMS21 TC-5]GGP81037.1 transporter [Streptomyces virginiae]GHI15478.1 transporter [Streptomyces virginiae]